MCRGRWVFPRPSDGRRWTKSDWDNWRNRRFANAGAAGLLDCDGESETWVGDFRPYDLRHTCASLMIRAHVGPADVAAQLGTSPMFEGRSEIVRRLGYVRPLDLLPTAFVAACEAKPGTRLELVTPSLPWKCSTN
jgi:integrase